jgi:hypothetical protein
MNLWVLKQDRCFLSSWANSNLPRRTLPHGVSTHTSCWDSVWLFLCAHNPCSLLVSLSLSLYVCSPPWLFLCQCISMYLFLGFCMHLCLCHSLNLPLHVSLMCDSFPVFVDILYAFIFHSACSHVSFHVSLCLRLWVRMYAGSYVYLCVFMCMFLSLPLCACVCPPVFVSYCYGMCLSVYISVYWHVHESPCIFFSLYLPACLSWTHFYNEKCRNTFSW